MKISKMQKYNNNLQYENNLYKSLNTELPVSKDTGYISITLMQDNLIKPISDAFLTISVNSDDGETVVHKSELTENPTLIELPIANPKGKLVKGIEYYFTPYNIEIEKEGYYKIITKNIRLFPNIKSMFTYSLNRIIPSMSNHDEITTIPPSPIDGV